MLGGNASERLIFGDTTTGSSNDIEKATDLARRMVTEYGMSDGSARSRSASATSSCSSAGRSASSATTPTTSPSRSTRRSGRSSTAPTSGRWTSSSRTGSKLDALAEKLVAEETVDSPEFEALFSDLPPEGEHPRSDARRHRARRDRPAHRPRARRQPHLSVPPRITTGEPPARPFRFPAHRRPADRLRSGTEPSSETGQPEDP